ncbi:helix-hairpin-helix domain-containing protein [Mucilaginibacter sp.]|uniref:ComEA family DNA-binding protein n=1 Tax=Mucilaginibacter sp. TaxID=1882438 RepID=UPI0025EA6F99|nr:helix-hairpin-helix domain-containing protein [Mucilaginibacter sp.]
MKTRIKNYLSITKKEWNALVVLVVLIALVLAALYVYQVFSKDNTINFKDFNKAAAQLNKAGVKSGFDPDKEAPETTERKTPPVMFPFNPNILTISQWQQLGLNEHQAEVIKHYTDKGGRFYNKQDLKKIYAITPDDYKRLEPYISIPDAVYTSNKLRPGEIIELNGADSTKLTALRGVGPASAVIILRYRNRLGGFCRKEQLKEVYGMDSLRYEEIKSQVSVNPAKIEKIPINSVSFDQLRLFPYLNYKQVNAVIEYRKQHGNYNSIDNLKNIVLLDAGILRKIEPYISYK